MADLDQLRSEAEAAIRSAGDSAELEELRVRYLGRKSELTSTLRSIGELPPDQRGPIGKAANEVRVALEQLLGRAHHGARGIGARPPPGRGPHRRDAAG